jgi:hypothetical protein
MKQVLFSNAYSTRDNQGEFSPLGLVWEPFSQGISILPREISSFSLGKIGITWENGVPKLALK